jgi:hypothetical protein
MEMDEIHFQKIKDHCRMSQKLCLIHHKHPIWQTLSHGRLFYQRHFIDHKPFILCVQQQLYVYVMEIAQQFRLCKDFFLWQNKNRSLGIWKLLSLFIQFFFCFVSLLQQKGALCDSLMEGVLNQKESFFWNSIPYVVYGGHCSIKMKMTKTDFVYMRSSWKITVTAFHPQSHGGR